MSCPCSTPGPDGRTPYQQAVRTGHDQVADHLAGTARTPHCRLPMSCWPPAAAPTALPPPRCWPPTRTWPAASPPPCAESLPAGLQSPLAGRPAGPRLHLLPVSPPPARLAPAGAQPARGTACCYGCRLPRPHPPALRSLKHALLSPGASASHSRSAGPGCRTHGQGKRTGYAAIRITERVGTFRPPRSQPARRVTADSCTFTGSGLSSGLDLSAPMFAPCLLGCPGTGRQHPVLTSLRLAGLRYTSACHSVPVTQVFKKVSLSSGLLIRWFEAQIPGGAEVHLRYICALTSRYEG
jgi:hypothetical protein